MAFTFLIDLTLFWIKWGLDNLSNILFSMLGMWKRRLKLPPLEEDDSIMALSATHLLGKLKNKEVTSESLVQSCIKRIDKVNAILNCVVDRRFEEALEEARNVDKALATLSYNEIEELFEQKPLLGLPFSCKEGIRMKGFHHSYGLPERRNYITTRDAECVQLLKESGAIPLCVTNVSELGEWWESSNYVYGTTNNPYDTRRTPGGSSGGEAALQTSAGICLSLGSDTGGSLRTPASFCGLFAHKPTPRLTSVRGTDIWDAGPNKMSDMQTVGPLCRYKEDLILMLKVLFGKENFGILQLDQKVDLKSVKIFYLDCPIGGKLSVSAVERSIKDSVQKVIEHLEEKLNIAAIPINIAELEESCGLFFAAIEKDSKGNPPFREFLSNFDGHASLFNEWICWLMGKWCHTFPSLVNLTMEETSAIFKATLPKCIRSVFSFSSDKNNEGGNEKPWHALKDKLMTILGDDGVLICPSHPTQVPFHYQSYTKPMNFIYTAIFNVLGFPATSVPVGLNEDGLPQGIQVVAIPNRDRLTLEVARSLEILFGGWIPPFELI